MASPGTGTQYRPGPGRWESVSWSWYWTVVLLWVHVTVLRLRHGAKEVVDTTKTTIWHPPVLLNAVSSFVIVAQTHRNHHIPHHRQEFQSAFSAVLLYGSKSSSFRSKHMLVPPTSIEECIDWINHYCDRTFLHAVIASDCHFLYRGIQTVSMNAAAKATAKTGTDRVIVDGTTDFNLTHTTATALLPLQPTIQQDIPDLLQVEIYGSDGVSFFQKIEAVLRNETIRPSVGHLGTTLPMDAAIWGDYSASVWPSMHSSRPTDSDAVVVTDNGVTRNSYAWFCNGGLFYPRHNSIIDRSSAVEIRRSIVIVDGDCPNHRNVHCHDSLVDALQYTNGCEIMFTTDTYLAVPSTYDKLLREQLRQSFLI